MKRKNIKKFIKKSKKGFTMVELIFVSLFLILAITAGTTVLFAVQASFSSNTSRAQGQQSVTIAEKQLRRYISVADDISQVAENVDATIATNRDDQKICFHFETEKESLMTKPQVANPSDYRKSRLVITNVTTNETLMSIDNVNFMYIWGDDKNNWIDYRIDSNKTSTYQRPDGDEATGYSVNGGIAANNLIRPRAMGKQTITDRTSIQTVDERLYMAVNLKMLTAGKDGTV